jgi:hypothetical protein
MTRTRLPILILLLIFIATPSQAQVQIHVNGRYIGEAREFLGALYGPAKAIAEALGATVTYDANTKHLHAVHSDIEPKEWASTHEWALEQPGTWICVNGRVAGYGINRDGTMYAEIRYLAEFSGAKVTYSRGYGKVIVTGKGQPELKPLPGVYIPDTIYNWWPVEPYHGRAPFWFGKVTLTDDGSGKAKSYLTFRLYDAKSRPFKRPATITLLISFYDGEAELVGQSSVAVRFTRTGDFRVAGPVTTTDAATVHVKFISVRNK